MAVTRIDYDIVQPFTVTQLNDIGPTAVLAFRNNSDLPHPAARSSGAPDFDTINLDNDANTIYLDPDSGNDANTGTDLSSDAILTLTRAWVLLSAARPNLHIEGTINSTWILTQDWTVAADNSFVEQIQCAAGQTGTINSTDYTQAEGPFRPQNTSLIFALDGIKIVDTKSDFSVFGKLPGFIMPNAAATTMHLKFCDIQAFKDGVRFNNVGVNTVNFENNVIRQEVPIPEIGGGVSGILLDVIGGGFTWNVKNNIIIGVDGITNIALSSLGTSTLNMDHNTIVGCDFVYGDLDLTAHTIHSNIYQRIGVLASEDVTPTLTITNSLINAGSTGGTDITSATNVVDQDPLFIDEAGGLATGFQLFHVGRSTSDGTPYPQNSPAVGIGLSDAGAWDFTYAPTAETLNSFALLLNDGYDFTAIPERQNYQAFNNIKGRFYNVWDDLNWKIPFSFKEKYWHGHDQTMRFRSMFQSKSLLRYYPEGDDGLWGTGGISVTVNTATQIDTGTNIPPRILPDGSTLSGSDQLRLNSLRGWILNITWTDGGAQSGFFEILNHDASEINLEHIRGDSDITSGSGFMANVVYLPVLLDMSSVTLYNEFGTENEIDGIQQAWQPQGSVTLEGTSSAEFHFREFVLRQTREEPLG